MANWTAQDNFGLLPNIIVRTKFKNGVPQWYELYPFSGYVLHIPSGDVAIYDFSGEIIIGTQPYYTYGGATIHLNYDFFANPNNYHADLYEEGMIVFG
jgi:hypothetical protein